MEADTDVNRHERCLLMSSGLAVHGFMNKGLKGVIRGLQSPERSQLTLSDLVVLELWKRATNIRC